MANLENRTRKDQILKYLLDRADQWVDGTHLATEQVGGSEGLRRLRDLRADGYKIQQRKHPDPDRDIWQYKLLTQPPEISPLHNNAISEYPVLPSHAATEKQRLTFGLSKICEYCKGKGTRAKHECAACNGRGWI